MAQVFKTPGVYRREIDLSEILVPAGISDGGVVVRSRKGPINRPVLVTNDKEYIDTFGKPYYLSGTNDTAEQSSIRTLIPEYGYGAYAALEYLKESSTLYVVRSFSTTDIYSSNEISSDLSIPASSAQATVSAQDSPTIDKPNEIYSIDQQKSNMGGTLLISSLYPGTDGNNLAFNIESFNVSADWRYLYDDYPTVVSATESSGNNPSEIAQHFPIANKVFKLNIYEKSDSQTWTDFYTNSADRTNSRVRVTPVETWYGTLQPQLDDNNNSLFIEDVVNGNSKYIYVRSSQNNIRFSYITSYGNLPVREDSNGDDFVDYSKLHELSGGFTTVNNGLNDTSPWSKFENREDVNVSILINPSWRTNVKQEVARIAAKRMDCIAVSQTGSLDKSTVTNILNQEEYGYKTASYVSLYAGYSKIYDKYNDKFVFLPNSIFGASLMARTDNIADPWSAPAGIDRATLSVFDQKKVFSFDEIGKLYDKNINTVRFIRGTGFVMWGQKTAQLKKSALDRINVRRNLLYIENNIENALLPFTFEPNNDKTRLRVFSLVDGFLETVLAGGGLTNYEVVCDETNNTAEVIDANQLNVDVYVQPTRVSEFIQLTTVITRTGISFSEVRI